MDTTSKRALCRALLSGALLGGAAMALSACGDGGGASPYQNTGSLPRDGGAYDDSIPGGPRNIEGPRLLEPIPQSTRSERQSRDGRARANALLLSQAPDEEPDEGDRPLPKISGGGAVLAQAVKQDDERPPATIRQRLNEGAGSSSTGDSNAPAPDQGGSGTTPNSGSGGSGSSGGGSSGGGSGGTSGSGSSGGSSGGGSSGGGSSGGGSSGGSGG